jgi:hypothetical protein
MGFGMRKSGSGIAKWFSSGGRRGCGLYDSQQPIGSAEALLKLGVCTRYWFVRGDLFLLY